MSSSTPGHSARSIGEFHKRWRWYHFYFLFALLDLAVILASIALYHRTVGSYRAALDDLAAVAERQRWITDLRVALVALNAPGNDIFETRDLQRERERFAELRGRIRELVARREAFDQDLSSFESHLRDMVRAEEAVFSAFAARAGPAPRVSGDPSPLDSASAAMATMDRHQAAALRDLVEIERQLRSEERSRLRAYGRSLERSRLAERAFFALVALVLASIFWFGRRLQRAHEQMLADQQTANDERSARLAAVGELCATVAHGIRNPLAGIHAAAEYAKEETSDGVVAEALNDILTESRRLEKRTRRLLDFARPLQAEVQDVSVRDALDEVARSLRLYAESARVHLAFDPPDPAMRLRADPELLVEAVAELVSNAIDATPQGGRVHVGAAEQDGKVVIRVCDSGAGIPEGVRRHAFELFFTTKPGGAGIGLATVRKLIELQRGTVEIESTGSEGTAFRIELAAASGVAGDPSAKRD